MITTYPASSDFGYSIKETSTTADARKYQYLSLGTAFFLQLTFRRFQISLSLIPTRSLIIRLLYLHISVYLYRIYESNIVSTLKRGAAETTFRLPNLCHRPISTKCCVHYRLTSLCITYFSYFSLVFTLISIRAQLNLTSLGFQHKLMILKTNFTRNFINLLSPYLC